MTRFLTIGMERDVRVKQHRVDALLDCNTGCLDWLETITVPSAPDLRTFGQSLVRSSSSVKVYRVRL